VNGADPHKLVEVSFDHDSSLMVALIVPDSIVKQLKDLKVIDDSNPATLQDDKFHVTLLWLGKEQQDLADDVERAVRSVVLGHEPLRAEIAGFGRFNKGEDGVPVIAMIDCKGLNLLQADLFKEVARVAELPSEHGFFPHMTIAYSDSPDVKMPVLEETVSWMVESVCVCVGKEDHRELRFNE
jgi:2'-5' RNA ligase